MSTKRRRYPQSSPDGDREPAPLSPVKRDLCHKIRQRYIAERSAFDSMRSGVEGRYRGAKQYDGQEPVMDEHGRVLTRGKPNQWLRILEFCASREIDPEDYIAAQFMGLKTREVPLEPNQICNEGGLQRWNEFQKQKDKSVRDELDIQHAVAYNFISFYQGGGVSKQDSCAAVVGNYGLALSALYRYCFARALYSEFKEKRFLNLAKRFRVQAALQFMLSAQDYLREWGDFIPPKFERKARSIWNQMYYEKEDE